MKKAGPDRRTVLVWGCLGAAASVVGPSVRVGSATEPPAVAFEDLVLRPRGQRAFDRDEWEGWGDWVCPTDELDG